MSLIQKTRRSKRKPASRLPAVCLLLVCFLSVTSWQTAYAAPTANPVTLAVEQIFIKPASSSAADTFTYKLTAKETGNPMPSGSISDGYTFTIDGTSSVDTPAVTFAQTGIYNYELSQYVASPKKGYTYDTQVYTVTVYIDYAHQADVIIQKKDGTKTDRITFENTYTLLASDPSLMVDPPVNKTVSGNPSKDGTFTFKLEAKDKESPMPTGSAGGVKTQTIVGSGSEDFGTWSYTEGGTYYYTISEVNTGESGYTYDTSVYTITDSVTDVDGQLVLNRTVTNASGKQVSSCAFINQYTDKSIASGISGPKTGDTARIGLYQAMLGISGFLFIVCMLYLFRDSKRKKEENFNS